MEVIRVPQSINPMYIEYIPDDLKIIIFYKLLDMGDNSWWTYMTTSYLVKRVVNKEYVIKNYLKSKLPIWYDILVEYEDITIDEDHLRAAFNSYDINKYFLSYDVITQYKLLRNIAETIKLDDITSVDYLRRLFTPMMFLPGTRYIQNVFGRYITKRNLPILYDKIKHIDISRLNPYTHGQISEELGLTKGQAYNVRTWLQISLALSMILDAGAPEILKFTIIGIVDKNFIVDVNSHGPPDYYGLIHYALLMDKNFNLDIQSGEILEFLTFSIWTLSSTLCEEVVRTFPKKILDTLAIYVRSQIPDMHTGSYTIYLDYVKFVLNL